jgi:hypothetical protein
VTAEVTVQESELLRLARAVVGQASYHEVERLLIAPRAAPTQLAPTAMGLLEETLSRGVSLSLMRGGGWRAERKQRLWERMKLPPMHFHAGSFQLLQWLLKTPLTETNVKALPGGKGALGWADEALLALTLSLVTDTPCEKTVASQPRVRASALCWLLQPAALARAEELGDPAPEVGFSASSPLLLFLEAWQPVFARSWAQMELKKGEVVDPGELARVSRAQDAVLGALLKAGESERRRELTGFLVEAAAEVFKRPLSGNDFVRNLAPTAPLRERTEARKHAGALMRAVVKLRGWDQEHRAVRFFEEGYAQAQAMVKAWEVLGDAGFREAERVLSELENPI